MENTEEVRSQIYTYCSNKPGAYEAWPFGPGVICFKVMGKIFAQLSVNESFFRITLKCEKEKAVWYRELFPQVVVRGYHCPPVQQPYWNTVNLDAFEDLELLLQMIDEAYEAVVAKFTKKEKARLLELTKLEFRDTDGEDEDFAMLCDKLDQTLEDMVGAKIQRSKYTKYNQRDSIHDVIVVYRDDMPVGCGSFKRYDEEHAELKRVYVDPTCHGIGLGEEIVRRLEAEAKIKGYHFCILETGELLKAACHVYEKLGYKVIPNYGQYADMPESLCMERKL